MSCLKKRGYQLLGRCVSEILDGQKIQWLNSELGIGLGSQTLERAFDSQGVGKRVGCQKCTALAA